MLTRSAGDAEARDASCANEIVSPEADAAPVQYIVTFPDAKNHYAQVSATLPTDGQDELELMMAAWTPGSYLLREYARNVGLLRATTQSGEPLPIRKTTKNRWRVETRGEANVLLSYDIYGREMTVRTNWIEADFAMLNGAPTFITLADGHRRRHDVRINPPRAWRKVITGLENHKDSRLHFKAPDYDTLVDSPIIVGNPELHEFEVEKKPHVLLNLGGQGIWDEERSAADTQRLVEEELALWGELPYERYVFMNVLSETGGGLEHKNSTLMMYSRWGSRDRQRYLRWLGLVAHEFFHTWNVKRLRPVDLGPFDYEKENYTESLWIAEGITSFYDDLIVHRAGLSTETEYFEALSRSVEAVMSAPGRLVQSLALSSYDAWIKLYRRDENFVNSGISYYTKGALVAWLLDAEIRSATEFERSLDDVMRIAYRRFSGDCGYTETQFRELVSEVAGRNLGEFFARHVDGTDELDFTVVFDLYGLRFKPREAPDAAGPQKFDPWFANIAPVFGVTTENENGRLSIRTVVAGQPAAEAGLNSGDEIIALGGIRVTPENFDARLKAHRPGETVEVTIARRDVLSTLNVQLDAAPAYEWKIEVDPNASEEQAERRRAWLSSNRTKS